MDLRALTIETPGVMKPYRRVLYDCVGEVLYNNGVARTTALAAPIERLENHTGEIFTCEFHPLGQLIVSAGMKQEIHICSVFEQSGSVMVMKGHWCAVMEVHFSSDGDTIYSCSSDQTVGIWDTFTGIRISKLKGHVGCVNTIQCARMGLPLLCSGGDDATIRLWDVRQECNVMTFIEDSNVMSACFSEDGGYIFTGSLRDTIKIRDIRTGEIVLELQGHFDAITGLSLSPCGNFLLSHSIDNSLRIWDVRPAYTGERCVQVFASNQYVVNGNLLKCAWSPDGTKISAGSSDEEVSVFSTVTGLKLDDLPGHSGSINDVDFHPSEQIIASASSDHCLFLHEALEW